MEEMMELIDDFVSDCLELLDAAEEDLLDLEENPEQEIINRIFRSFHSVKGSAAMLGFTNTSQFAHLVEDLFMDVRAGKVAIDKTIADQLLVGIDALKDGIGTIRETGQDTYDYTAPTARMSPDETPTQAAPEPQPEPEPQHAAQKTPDSDKTLPPTPPPPTTSEIINRQSPQDVSVFSRKDGKIKCLVVDDDFTARMLLSTYLTRFGICHVAKDGTEAVEAVRASFEGDSPEPYDLICVDIMMPRMDGITATRVIREVESEVGVRDSAHEAVIFITTAIDDDKVAFQSIYEAGANNYFTKPLSFKDIHRQLVISALLPPDA